MSTVSYALITARREKSNTGRSKDKEPPGVGTYVDILAALVPAEVLALHALFLEETTTTTDSGTVITDPTTLQYGFYLMAVFSALFYVVPKLFKKQWAGKIDYLRTAIPLFAFIAWTMIQKMTAFDAFWPSLPEGPRFLFGCSLAVLLMLFAGSAAKKADQHDPTRKDT